MTKELKTDIIKFLCGESDFCGLWFGDKHPSEVGAFWWRKHLRKTIEDRDAKIQHLESLVKAADEVINDSEPKYRGEHSGYGEYYKAMAKYNTLKQSNP